MSKEKNKSSTAALHEKIPVEKSETDKLLEHPEYQELQKKLMEAEEKAHQNWERMLRTQADTENTLSRMQRDMHNTRQYALEKFISELLPIIDNLERALMLKEEGAEDHSVLEGVKLTLKMFSSTLEKFGVQQIHPLAEAFNPDLHQAVSTQPDETVEPGTVLSVLQKGYLLNQRLIRPALVVVAKELS